MPLAALRLTFVSNAESAENRHGSLTGLDLNATPALPGWVKEHVGSDTWTGRALQLDKLREASLKLPPYISTASREERIPYQAPDGTSMELDLTLPLLLLARDLNDLNENGKITLEGA